jgi:hypothetical protein
MATAVSLRAVIRALPDPLQAVLILMLAVDRCAAPAAPPDDLLEPPESFIEPACSGTDAV